jgi:hypothetical protein
MQQNDFFGTATKILTVAELTRDPGDAFCQSERSRGCNAADVVGEARLSISNLFQQ